MSRGIRAFGAQVHKDESREQRQAFRELQEVLSGEKPPSLSVGLSKQSGTTRCDAFRPWTDTELGHQIRRSRGEKVPKSGFEIRE